jgi:hypothetical protein
MSFCPETPEIGTPTTLEARNFLCKPPIEVRFEEKLKPSLRDFERYVTRHLHVSKSGRFLTFSDRESNWQFDSRPFFGHNLCFKY